MLLLLANQIRDGRSRQDKRISPTDYGGLVESNMAKIPTMVSGHECVQAALVDFFKGLRSLQQFARCVGT